MPHVRRLLLFRDRVRDLTWAFYCGLFTCGLLTEWPFYLWPFYLWSFYCGPFYCGPFYRYVAFLPVGQITYIQPEVLSIRFDIDHQYGTDIGFRTRIDGYRILFFSTI